MIVFPIFSSLRSIAFCYLNLHFSDSGEFDHLLRSLSSFEWTSITIPNSFQTIWMNGYKCHFKLSTNPFSLLRPFNLTPLERSSSEFSNTTNKKKLVNMNWFSLIKSSRCHDNRSSLQGNPQMTPKAPKIVDTNVPFIWESVRLTDYSQCQSAMGWMRSSKFICWNHDPRGHATRRWAL